MREALFIKKNKQRWEEMVVMPSSNADEMAEEFTQLTDDLGFAKTFYPHSNITKVLNNEASKRYLNIYKNRKEERNKFVTFFKYDVPLVVAKHQMVILICFLLFIIFFFVGFFSAKNDSHYLREIMGNGYVDMTEKNIEEGNPFGVYQSGNSFIVWLGIMINNISVSFRFFLEGLAFPYFLMKDLIETAVMVGAFDYMFYSKGLGNLFILTVMIHGTLELSAITLAAAAGIIMGKSWIFPGTLSRLQAFKQGAKDGLKLIIGLVPVFAIAAFFEGFVTRHYRMLMWMSLSILLASLFFVVGYFGIYPIWLSKKIKKEIKSING